MRLESIKFVLPAGCWPGESKSSGGVWIALFKPLDRLHSTVCHQYMVEHLYSCESVTLLLSELGLGPAVVELNLAAY